MRFMLLTPGTGHFYCGSCLRDDALGRALRAQGHEVESLPLYLPMMLEHSIDSEPAVHMGGINVYLQQKTQAFRMLPRFIANMLDNPRLLRWASRRGNMTESSDLGEMTVSILRGECGRQEKEVDKLVEAIQKKPRPDVIIISNAMLSGVARRLRAALKVPVVVTMQGEAPFLDSLKSSDRDIAWATLRERAHEVDALIAVSANYRDAMQAKLEVPAERVHVVCNGVDVEDFAGAPKQTSDAVTLGYLARMCRDKGLDTLVDAFIALKSRAKVPGLRLRVAGVQLKEDRAYVDELQARMRAAGCLGDAEFLPNIDRAQKIEFLKTLTAFSVPARYQESFGLYLLEAMAAGVPVVQPRHAAFPEILQATGGGMLCEPESPESLAEALEPLLLDPAYAKEVGARGQAGVREAFTSRHMAEGVAEICRSLVTASSP